MRATNLLSPLPLLLLIGCSGPPSTPPDASDGGGVSVFGQWSLDVDRSACGLPETTLVLDVVDRGVPTLAVEGRLLQAAGVQVTEGTVAEAQLFAALSGSPGTSGETLSAMLTDDGNAPTAHVEWTAAGCTVTADPPVTSRVRL